MRSTEKAPALPLLDRIAVATLSAASLLMSNTATVAPSSAKRRQIADPIPPAPPVTTTTLPLSPLISSPPYANNRSLLLRDDGQLFSYPSRREVIWRAMIIFMICAVPSPICRPKTSR